MKRKNKLQLIVLLIGMLMLPVCYSHELNLMPMPKDARLFGDGVISCENNPGYMPDYYYYETLKFIGRVLQIKITYQ